MVTGKKNECFVKEICLFQDLNEPCKSLINASTRLIILSKFTTGFCRIRQESRNLHVLRFKKDFLDPLMTPSIVFVSKKIWFQFQRRVFVKTTSTMGITGSEVEKERLITFQIDNLSGSICHLDCIAWIPLEYRFEVIHLLWRHVVLSNTNRSVLCST